MSNSFSKEERVAFSQLTAGFEDALVMSNAVSKYLTDGTDMERSNDVVWRPQPYIVKAVEGADQSANFKDKTQLSVPAYITRRPVVTYNLTPTQMRDMLQGGRLYDAAKRELASQLNKAVQDTVALYGAQVVAVSTASTSASYQDISLAESLLTEIGVPMTDRYMGLNSRDYNGLADNVQGLSRSFGNAKSDSAFERSFVGSQISNFDLLKLDYTYRLAAAGGSSDTIDTQAAAGNYHVPAATSTAATGEISNVDNRFQTITVSDTTSVAAGDAFTIAGVNSVHMQTKADTGQLKTFRVVEVVNGTSLKITPAIISNQGGSEAEEQYQNCTVSESATAAITYLNANAAGVNPFWHKDSVEVLPGTLVIDNNSGAGVMKAATENGYEITFQKQYDIKTSKTLFRVDIRFGTVNLCPEMNGILIFGQ